MSEEGWAAIGVKKVPVTELPEYIGHTFIDEEDSVRVLKRTEHVHDGEIRLIFEEKGEHVAIDCLLNTHLFLKKEL